MSRRNGNGHVPHQPKNKPAGTRERQAERRLKAFELRKGGASYRSIARELHISESTAHDYVVGRLRELATLEAAVAEDVKALELARLDAMFLGSYPAACSGDVAATKACLKIMERRAALLGLDAAKVSEQPGDLSAFLAALSGQRTNGSGERVYDA